jgi:hypothetical protein
MATACVAAPGRSSAKAKRFTPANSGSATGLAAASTLAAAGTKLARNGAPAR